MAHALSDAPPTTKWSDLAVRTASALVLGPIAILCLWQGGWPWRFLLLAALVGLSAEWRSLARIGGRARENYIFWGTVTAACLVAVSQHFLIGCTIVAAGAIALLAVAGWFAAAGLPYIFLGGLALLWLRTQPVHGFADTLFLIAVVWGTDIGAYLFGRICGGPKMAPQISPAKTWSGALGGLGVGGVAGIVIAGGHFAAVPAALLLSVAAQAGDLLESAIKRRLGVKDSGWTIPGHGGLFDRLDGFLAAAPVAVILALGGALLWG